MPGPAGCAVCAAPAAGGAATAPPQQQHAVSMPAAVVKTARNVAWVLLLLGLLALLSALVAARRKPICFHGHAGGFGGRAWGWEASGSLVLLASSAVLFLLGSAVVLQLMWLSVSVRR